MIAEILWCAFFFVILVQYVQMCFAGLNVSSFALSSLFRFARLAPEFSLEIGHVFFFIRSFCKKVIFNGFLPIGEEMTPAQNSVLDFEKKLAELEAAFEPFVEGVVLKIMQGAMFGKDWEDY
jgi:hypothetical protein